VFLTPNFSMVLEAWQAHIDYWLSKEDLILCNCGLGCSVLPQAWDDLASTVAPIP
jgi:hypothetical protein